MPESRNGILLLAKQSGLTSFASLWQAKNALGTKKIGHTGTLDTFADGLLVLLAGRLTRLGPYITGCDKEYRAIVSFGAETDTLDPEGVVVRESPLPLLSDINRVLPSFTGEIMQRPPAYSALHIDGMRASDRIRKGETVEIPARPVSIYSISIEEAISPSGDRAAASDFVSRLSLRVSCSKGTYIRALARDLALDVGSSGYLSALRRTRIGPFSLDNSAGFSLLPAFGSIAAAPYGKGEKPPAAPAEEILRSLISFAPNMASLIGLPSVSLDPSRGGDFLDGKRLSPSWFAHGAGTESSRDERAGDYAVFCGKDFMGVITYGHEGLTYGFVAGNRA
jgi:tRNA pseudouridine55 synthase